MNGLDSGREGGASDTPPQGQGGRVGAPVADPSLMSVINAS